MRKLYRNNLKNREFDQEAPQNLCSEQAPIAHGQGASENKDSEGLPTQPPGSPKTHRFWGGAQSKTDSTGCFGIWFCLFCSFLWGDNLFVDYQRMNRETFDEKIVGNTIVGITRQSRSLYMLYFRAGGSCDLWKQNQIYSGRWWIDQDPKGEDIVHAFWPDYISQEPKSLFSPQNPSYGKPTSLRYYFDPASGGVFVAGKAFQTSVLLVPGFAFPPLTYRLD